MNLRGVYTALITPFLGDADASLDIESLNRLIDFNIQNGVNGLVPCGTTGESPTLSNEEHLKVIETTVKRASGKVQVIAGTGSNSTREAIDLSIEAQKLGVDGVLLVNPYYNKPTQEGLFRHFCAVAKSVSVPVVLYNIQGRTGINLETSNLVRIVEACPNVIGIKEASGNLEQVKKVIETVKGKYPSFSILSGDDKNTLPIIRMGGQGVISVASNLIPKDIVKFVNHIFGNYEDAAEMHKRLSPLFDAMFVETNPIPIKCMLYLAGICKEVYRLPLCELGLESREAVHKALREHSTRIG